ncbi:MAG: DUF1844 domain-containing protein [Polyangiaceae bacterium]
MSDNGPDSKQQRQAREAFDDATGEQLPAIDFATFVLSLAHSGRVHLGDAPDPAAGTQGIEGAMARQTIDLLALLQEKTKGNLSGEEETLLAQALYDLRMRYVEVMKPR